MKFTEEEISLCKQVAEKYRKKIKYGDWFLSNKVVILKNNFIRGTIHIGRQAIEKFIPLWTISDCLEFLSEKGFAVENLRQPGWKNWSISIKHESVLHILNAKWTGKELEIRSNKTPLEACLKVVLAVLEED